ncbi:lytic transglycosylase domain-containing protein [Pseudomonas viridiflava]|uniref:lytic transglycosylase domain-containing protein n=1 Tax=Pseudomonas viridiflava TaxID=33069 RepID=UPI000F027CE3|nr:lytic transglycosylase domain-containing protein [Pseudomonas viridiflava]
MLTPSAFLALALQCAPSIHPSLLTPIVKTESSFNPWAIGIVGQTLPSQPQSRVEALTVIERLVKEGANFSVGLGQINKQHFDVNHPEVVLDPCTNLRMAAAIIESCYSAANVPGLPVQTALLKTISCYYSGNPTRGFKSEKEFGGSSHVQRVIANADNPRIKVPALIPDSSGQLQSNDVQTQPSVPATYESWDVMRQYPRYDPPVQKKPPAPIQQEQPQENEESSDAW